MKMCLSFLFIALLVSAIAPPALTAQTAAELETVLATETLSYEQAASFVLRAADVPFPGTALSYALEQKWLPAKAVPGDTAVLDRVALLIMGAFGIKGGIMYSAVKSPRYAYRELVYQGIIQGRSDPQLAVSGDFLLFMIGKVLGRTEEDNQ
ncbi:MAG: hypothetical protein LBV17_04760 [Treponema sp.]|jgi:hypothetical protein|nr:hypothetical protein [Treponema sp.]